MRLSMASADPLVKPLFYPSTWVYWEDRSLLRLAGGGVETKASTGRRMPASALKKEIERDMRKRLMWTLALGAVVGDRVRRCLDGETGGRQPGQPGSEVRQLGLAEGTAEEGIRTDHIQTEREHLDQGRQTPACGQDLLGRHRQERHAQHQGPRRSASRVQLEARPTAQAEAGVQGVADRQGHRQRRGRIRRTGAVHRDRPAAASSTAAPRAAKRSSWSTSTPTFRPRRPSSPRSS